MSTTTTPTTDTTDTTAYKHVQPRDFDFTQAKHYRKTAVLPKANIFIAQGGEEVTTTQPSKDGTGTFTETKSVAENGDFIVTRTAEDKYVIRKAKFPHLYEEDPENPTQYRAMNHGHAIQVHYDFSIDAPWGETQYIKAGGYIFHSVATNQVYGNQQDSFEADFAPSED